MPTKITQSNPYPNASRGPLSEDHSAYAWPINFKGQDPDVSFRRWFIVLIILFCLLFIWAVTTWVGTGWLHLG